MKPITLAPSQLQKQIAALGPWFHNMDIAGVATAPDHFLGDYPRIKWRTLLTCDPRRPQWKDGPRRGLQRGVLFIGNEASRSAAAWLGSTATMATWHRPGSPPAPPMSSRVSRMSVYELPRLGERFDVVLFLGVLYHLRHPLLVLEFLYDHAVGETLVFQSMCAADLTLPSLREDYPITDEQVFDDPNYPRLHSSSALTLSTRPTGGSPIAPVPRPCCAARDSRSSTIRKRRSTSVGEASEALENRRPHRNSREDGGSMIEAVMLWNEPNNLSHWNFELDPGWAIFADMVKSRRRAVRSENRKRGARARRHLAHRSRVRREHARAGVLEEMDIVAAHGFPLDWNHWQIRRVAREARREIRAVTNRPLWVTEVGASTFGAEEVQEFGLKRTVELSSPGHRGIHWYSLYDFPRAWPATTRHREARGLVLLPPFLYGALARGWQLPSAPRAFRDCMPDLGICQWFHFEDPRLDDAVAVAQRARRSPPAHRFQLGRQLSAGRRRNGSIDR